MYIFINLLSKDPSLQLRVRNILGFFLSTGDLKKTVYAGIPGHAKSWHYLCIIFPVLPTKYNVWLRCTTLSFLCHRNTFLFLLCSEDSHNHSSGPISRTDEQSLLSRILHQTAQYVILVIYLSLNMYKSKLADRKNLLKYILYK